MAINRASMTNLLSPGLYRVFWEEGKEVPLTYQEFMNTPEMPWNPIASQQVAGLGNVPTQPEGTQFTLDEPKIGSEGTHTAIPYGLAVEITREAWEDELYGVMQKLTASMKRQMRYRLEINAWSLLNDAHTAAGSATYTGFDEDTLCASHDSVYAGGASQTNTSAASLSVAWVQTALQHFYGMTNDRGNPQLMAPTQVILHYNNAWVAREIFGSAGKPYTTDNEINAILQDDLKYMVSRYLTTSTDCFMLVAKGEHDMNYSMRTPVDYNMFDDPWTGNAIETCYMRDCTYFDEWRGVYGNRSL